MMDILKEEGDSIHSIQFTSDGNRLMIIKDEIMFHYDLVNSWTISPYTFLGTCTVKDYQLSETEQLFRDVNCGNHSGIPWCCILSYIGDHNNSKNWHQDLDLNKYFNGYILCCACIVRRMQTQTKQKPLKHCTCGIDHLNNTFKQGVTEET